MFIIVLNDTKKNIQQTFSFLFYLIKQTVPKHNEFQISFAKAIYLIMAFTALEWMATSQ